VAQEITEWLLDLGQIGLDDDLDFFCHLLFISVLSPSLV
jgi:hypothetical protein